MIGTGVMEKLKISKKDIMDTIRKENALFINDVDGDFIPIVVDGKVYKVFAHELKIYSELNDEKLYGDIIEPKVTTANSAAWFTMYLNEHMKVKELEKKLEKLRKNLNKLNAIYHNMKQEEK